jgi:hypothetical protein
MQTYPQITYVGHKTVAPAYHGVRREVGKWVDREDGLWYLLRKIYMYILNSLFYNKIVMKNILK